MGASLQPWFVYLLECVSGKIYTGITSDLDRRFEKHKAGKGAKFTKRDPPLYMIAAKKCGSRSDATKEEIRIKKLTPAMKRALGQSWPHIIPLPQSISLKKDEHS